MLQNPYRAAFQVIVAALARGAAHSRLEQPRDLRDRLMNALNKAEASPEQTETLAFNSPDSLSYHLTRGESPAKFLTERLEASGWYGEMLTQPDEAPLDIDGKPAWLITQSPSSSARACLLAPQVFRPEDNLSTIEYALDAAIEQLIAQRERVKDLEVHHQSSSYRLSACSDLPRLLPQVPLVQIALLPVLNGDGLDIGRFEAIERSLSHWASSEALDPYRDAVWGLGPREIAHWCEPVPLLRRITARVPYVCLMTRVNT